MNGGDWFDLGIRALPRKTRAVVVLVLLALPGGVWVNWYVNEKVGGYQQLVTEIIESFMDDLLPQTERPVAPGPKAV